MSQPVGQPQSLFGGRGFGSLWMLLPAALGAVAGALWLGRSEPRRDVLPPVVSDPNGAIDAFAGRLEGDLGTALVARLARLHPDAARQAFEARALAERFGLGEGQPWRLSVHWEPGALVPAGQDAAVVHLGAVEVHDEAGLALGPLDTDSGAGGTGGAGAVVPKDPLRALFAPPRGTLEPGERVDWVLWGRSPRAEARVVGLMPAGGASDELLRLSGLAGPIELAPSTLRRSELMLPVARLDRSGPQPDDRPGEDRLADESGKMPAPRESVPAPAVPGPHESEE